MTEEQIRRAETLLNYRKRLRDAMSGRNMRLKVTYDTDLGERTVIVCSQHKEAVTILKELLLAVEAKLYTLGVEL